MTNQSSASSAGPIHLDSTFEILIASGLVSIFSYLAARVGGALVLRPEMIWPLWPGCAILVAVLLLTPRKAWPALLVTGLAGFAVYDVQEHLSIRAICFLLAADSIEILVAALGVSYAFGGIPRLDSVKSLAKYSLFALILAPIAVASLAASAFETDSWVVSFLAEALALLTLTPAILSWANIGSTRLKKPEAHYLEAASLCVGLYIFGYFTFFSVSRPALLYSLVPFLLWAALRFGIAGASNSMVLVAFLAILGVVHGRGPFTGDTPVKNILFLQLFLLVAGSSFMVLAAVVGERKLAEHALGESEERLRLAVQTGKMFAYSWDAATDVIERSGEAVEILGVNEKEAATGAAISAMVHSGDKEKLETAVAQLAVENPTLQITYRINRPDGKVVWLERNSRAYFDGNGNLKRMVGMIVDVTERKVVENALASLSGRLIEAQEEERKRIAREIHDDFNQRLAMVAIDLEEISENLKDCQSEAASQRLHDLFNRVSEVGADLHSLSHTLHSSTLDNLGLVVSVRALCTELTQQGIQVDFADENVPQEIPGDVALCLFRIVQEGLRNVERHSGAHRAEVRIEGHGESIRLSISDHGRGIDLNKPAPERGIGIRSMEERLRLLGGRLEVHSRPMTGTRIEAWLPLKTASAT